MRGWTTQVPSKREFATERRCVGCRATGAEPIVRRSAVREVAGAGVGPARTISSSLRTLPGPACELGHGSSSTTLSILNDGSDYARLWRGAIEESHAGSTEEPA
jgi:hypothetical protein